MTSLLILGGTAWLGHEVAAQALSRGWEVTCLARGPARPPTGSRWVRADRTRPEGYDGVRDREWDLVVDVSWQPDQVASALRVLAARAARWVYVSSGSVYADHSTPDADESSPLVEPAPLRPADVADYAGAKVRCEQLVSAALGERALLVRSGLIAGPGDSSDRWGYWVGRLALAEGQRVLVPDEPRLMTQAVDVRDLAAFILLAGPGEAAGAVDAVGEPIAFTDLLARAGDIAGFAVTPANAPPAWLEESGVQPWAGERSLPLWLPLPQYAGFSSRSARRAVTLGLARRPVDAMLAEVLVDERDRGLERPRRAGLTRSDELDLIGRLPGA